MYCNSKKLETTQMSITETRIFKTVVCLQCRILRFCPGSGRSPGEGNDYPLRYSCLEHFLDRGAWGATAPGWQSRPQRAAALSCLRADVVCFHRCAQHYCTVVRWIHRNHAQQHGRISGILKSEQAAEQ